MSRTRAWRWGIAAGLALTAAALWRYTPPVPTPVRLRIWLDAESPGVTDPILCTGRTGEGDILYCRRLEGERIVLGYDAWGTGGPVSAPLELRPGTWHALEVDMPSLARVPEEAAFRNGRLRVVFDGREVLSGPVLSHVRTSSEMTFGLNPIGGTVVGPQLNGRLAREDGTALPRDPHLFYGPIERIGQWAVHGWRQWLLIALAAMLVGRAAGTLRITGESLSRAGDAALRHRWFLLSAAAAAAVFSWFVTGGSFQFLYPESFGSFFDHQAASLLHGHFDVPEEALAGESFLIHGKFYGYFGLTPALLRIPFVVFGMGFACLSRAFMLGYFLVALASSYLILLHAETLAPEDARAARAWPVVLFTLMVGMGSTLIYLSSRAYIYHEATLCGVACALVGAYAALRYLAAPGTRWWLGSLLAGLLAVQARPPSGLFALACTGCVALVCLLRARGSPGFPRALVRHGAIGVLSVLAVLSFNGVSYLKFGTFEGAPLRYHVQYTPARLAKFGGKNFSLANLTFDASAYLKDPNIYFARKFPWIYVRKPLRPKPGGPKMDHIENILAIPYAMPGLTALALVGGLFGARRFKALRGPAAVASLAAIPMALAMFTAAALAHRYTADFCPFLIVMGAIGMASLETLPRRPRRLAAVLMGVLAAVSIAVNGAITLHYQGEQVWGVPDEVHARYEALRDRVGRAVDAVIGPAPEEPRDDPAAKP